MYSIEIRPSCSALPIALGLAAAHERGLIHRGVKPANILLESGSESRVKLTDFGIARAVDAASTTQSGLLAGKSRRWDGKRPVLAAMALVLLVALGWGLGQLAPLVGWTARQDAPSTEPSDSMRQVVAKPVIRAAQPEAAVSHEPPGEVGAAEEAPVRTEAERWEQAVALMAVDDRLQAVVARLKKLNPECEEIRAQWQVEGDRVSSFQIDDTRSLFDLSPLRALLGLKDLRLIGQEHLDLEPLRGMALNRLDSVGNHVRDLSPLQSLPLTYLCINRTQVADLSPLAGMPLQTLEMELTQVTDLTPIAGCPLELLSLHGSPIADYSPLARMPLRELRFDCDPAVHAQLLRSIRTLEVVNGKPFAEILGGGK